MGEQCIYFIAVFTRIALRTNDLFKCHSPPSRDIFHSQGTEAISVSSPKAILMSPHPSHSAALQPLLHARCRPLLGSTNRRSSPGLSDSQRAWPPPSTVPVPTFSPPGPPSSSGHGPLTALPFCTGHKHTAHSPTSTLAPEPASGPLSSESPPAAPPSGRALALLGDGPPPHPREH